MGGLELNTLEKPLPKLVKDPAGYASTRLLEALLESILALEFLEKGYTRNAAGKAFQAWKALTAAILALELPRLESLLKSERERKWVKEKGILRTPTSRLLALASLLEKLGYEHFRAYTHVALNLHEYQYHGPDPDMELSRYRSRAEAVEDIERLIKVIVRHVERLGNKLGEKHTSEHKEALEHLRKRLEKIHN
ncbi:PaREP1 family protein [Pyrolobus fumarii 1A]|uniref:PaREP1 family protein n=1 Tax=Pyrolobus fumarii (strain DSM 11204 / 1A) TaxID=694429 RepID=G0EG91_PYRF1|nr:PaREP1 family protein [Pyrolobus fumarii]AEM39116.1 PaREP1 family protein [Pyrolobus fumarii 1A]